MNINNNVKFTIVSNVLKEIKINPDFKDKEIKIVLPDEVKTIQIGAFTKICEEKSSPVITIIAPNVEIIDRNAFYKCKYLKSITVPKVKTIKQHAFNSCESLKSIQINNVETIESEAFFNCSNLKSIELPSSVNIAEDSFLYCDELNQIKIRYDSVDVYVDKVTNDKKEVIFEYRILSSKKLDDIILLLLDDIILLLKKIFNNDEITKQNLKKKLNSPRDLSKKDNVLDKIPKELFDKIMEYDGYKLTKKKSRRRKSSKKKSKKRSKKSNKKKKSKRHS